MKAVTPLNGKSTPQLIKKAYSDKIATASTVKQNVAESFRILATHYGIAEVSRLKTTFKNIHYATT